ncbi:hypothetical protein DXG03_004617 [Asterophora parasitica]|uniref:Amine oxidase n=1 Tax=Asterophora parasitica TaxID=117018 RepID=A0A9P7GET7_9AGAR|nr:hypothetical protein DXG03_004617 [Asterophora parasitica]
MKFFALVLGRAILDELALAACLARDPPISAAARRTHTDLRAVATARAIGRHMALFNELDAAVDPVTHRARPDPPAALAPDVQHRRRLEPAAGEAYHLAVVVATGIRAAGGVIIKNVLIGDVRGVSKEDLGVRGAVVREEDEEARSLFVKDSADGEIDLRETRRAALAEEGVRQSHICNWSLSYIAAHQEGNMLTFVAYSSFNAGLAWAPKGMSADEFEVFSGVVHFLPLQVGNNDKDFVTARVVHPPQQHEFREL